MSRSRLSLAGMRMAYFTPRASRASYISGLAKAASARKTTSLPGFCCRSISGNSSSSQSSALWTLPGRSLQRVVTSRLEVAVVGALLLPAVHRNLGRVHVQHDPLRGIESFLPPCR